jgi:hypothetical protein
MPVREKPDDWLEPEFPRPTRASVEREVNVSHAIDGMVSDGPALARVTPIEVAQRRPGIPPHDRGRRRRKLRFSLVLGALLLAALPLVLQSAGMVRDEQFSLEAVRPGTLLTGMWIVKAAMATVALVAIAWRLRRRASVARRIGYFAGTWAMAAGLGLVNTGAGQVAGTLLFDSGIIVLMAFAFGDDYLRRDRAPTTPA